MFNFRLGLEAGPLRLPIVFPFLERAAGDWRLAPCDIPFNLVSSDRIDAMHTLGDRLSVRLGP